ncbi:hypothetical protein BVX99_00805 [bacterium F16]|nr:hypothetical protein BVX99_00805 [bacterium F16]
MKAPEKLMMFAIAFIAILTIVPSYGAPKTQKNKRVIIDGVVPGKATQDYDAAMTYAREKNLPVLLTFTGSDWCQYCQFMEKSVFGKDEWTDYSKNNLVEVWLDYPKVTPDLVPEKYRKRNADLEIAYRIRGALPTYVVLDSNGDVLDKLGANQYKTPASFKLEIQNALLMSEAGIKAYVAKLKPEDSDKAIKSFEAYNVKQEKEFQLMKAFAAARKETADTKRRLLDALEAGKVNAMNKAKRTEYAAAKKALEEVTEKYESWMRKNAKSKPTQKLNDEYNQLEKELFDAEFKVDSF